MPILLDPLGAPTPPPERRPPDDVAQLREHFAALAGGELKALDAIYRACADDLFGLALWRTGTAADAADVVQDLFVRIAQLRTALRDVQNPRAYLRRLAHNLSVDRQRRSRRQLAALDAEVPFVRPVVDGSDDINERRFEAQRLCRLLEALAPAQREAVFLRHMLGCSFAEIGRVTGVPVFTAASRVRLGLRHLRKLAGVES